MSDYNSHTVVQLRELLKQRGLAPQGLKNELVERLVKNDNEKPKTEADGQGDQNNESVDVKQREENQDKDNQDNQENKENQEAKDSMRAEAVDNAGTEGEMDLTEEGKESSLGSQEKKDYKQMAVDLLNKKLHRAKKFGQDQEQIDSLQKLLTRIEKFGLDPNMPIAQEVGMVPLKVHGPRLNKSKKSKKFSKKSQRRH